MNDIVDKFYNIWAKKAQFETGLYEQRYYTNGELAPSWGIQIDETAAIVIGINEFGNCRKSEEIIVKAINGILGFINEEYLSKPCYDLWEERKGVHLYSTASIYEALRVGRKMLSKINKLKYKEEIQRIDKSLPKIHTAIRNNFVENFVLKRSINDTKIDISLLSVVIPFEVFDDNNVIVKNTVQEIEKKLKLSNEGYMRYQDDSYIGGNAWIISSLWLSLYYIRIGNKDKAKELFDWVTNHADNLDFLPEQIERDGHKTAWISQLAWSHAMYIITLLKLKE